MVLPPQNSGTTCFIACASRPAHSRGALASIRKLPNIPVVDWLPACLADKRWNQATAAAVLEGCGPPVLDSEVPHAPTHQGQDHRVELLPSIRQQVLITGRMGGVLPTLEDPSTHQR